MISIENSILETICSHPCVQDVPPRPEETTKDHPRQPPRSGLHLVRGGPEGGLRFAQLGGRARS